MILPDLVTDEDYTLTERVFHSLKAGILSLQIKPREYLIIGDVAREYQISRTPVREAIIRLEHEGWVEQEGRRGAKVTVPSPQSIMEVIEIQAALEGYVVRRATRILTEEDFRDLDALLTQADHALQIGDPDRSRRLGDDFHRFLAEKVGNRRLRAQIEELQQHIDRIRPLIWQKDLAPVERSNQQHRQIFQSIQSGNESLAEERMINHTIWFEAELSSILLQV